MIDYESYKKANALMKLGVPYKRISEQLNISISRLQRWALLPEEQFLLYLNGTVDVKAEKYRDYIISILSLTPQTSNSSIYEKCKMDFKDFDLTQRSFFRYLQDLRYSTGYIKSPHKIRTLRPEDAPGFEGQVDFGQYIMKNMYGMNITIYFFCMVLAYSRMKFVYFSPDPFTSETACIAHDYAFKYFGGRPQTLLYDQDRLFLVSENFGNFILAKTFEEYARKIGFTVRFCRKHDPDTKGKIETTVKDIKQRFLPGRIYSGIDILNSECLNWLDRVGNGDYHTITKQIPRDMFKDEIKYLQKVKFESKNQTTIIRVCDCNYISYKGNTYDIPPEENLRFCMVKVVEEDGMLLIYRPSTDILICKYKIPEGEGHKLSGKIGMQKGNINVRGYQIDKFFGDSEIKNKFIHKMESVGDKRYIDLQKQKIVRLTRYYKKEDILEGMKYCINVNKCHLGELISFMIYKHGRNTAKNILNTIDLATYNRRAKEIKEELYGKN